MGTTAQEDAGTGTRKTAQTRGTKKGDGERGRRGLATRVGAGARTRDGDGERKSAKKRQSVRGECVNE